MECQASHYAEGYRFSLCWCGGIYVRTDTKRNLNSSFQLFRFSYRGRKSHFGCPDKGVVNGGYKKAACIVKGAGGVDGCDCEETLKLIAEGKLDTEPLITHTYPLAKIDEAYELFENKRDGVIKVAVEC